MASKPQTESRECFAHNITSLRVSMGLSQLELARRCGLSRTEVSRFERGVRSPRLEMILTLAKTLEVEPGELLESTS